MTKEELNARFDLIEKKVLGDELNDTELDDATSFIIDYRAQLRTDVPNFDKRSIAMGEHVLYRHIEPRMIKLESKTDGCGKCRGCLEMAERRKKLILN